MKKILMILLIIQFFSNSSRQEEMHKGPELVNVIRVDIAISKNNTEYSQKDFDLIDSNKFIIKADNNDIKSIKVILNPDDQNTYSIMCIFKNSKKLNKISKEWYGKRVYFFVDKKFSSGFRSYVILENIYLPFGSFKKKEIIKLIGKDHFDEYSKLLK